MIETLAQIKSGDHVALLYRTRREQLACSIPFIEIGLAANERCLYIADSNPISIIRQALVEAGINVEDAEKRNALRILTKNETYLSHGLFEPAEVLSSLEQWIDLSLEMGFQGFRAAGEMTWALDLPSSFAALLDYARQLQTKCHRPFVGLCQFDETRFPKPVVEQIVAIHSKVIKDGVFVKNSASNPRASSVNPRRE